MLYLLGLAGGGLVLAACGGSTSTSKSNLNSTAFDVPDPAPGFPKGPVELRWVDSGDQKAVFFRAFFAAFQQKFSNVHVTYDGTNWNTIQQELTLGLRNGTAPDAFQLPLTITTAQAVQQGWIAALDDFVPNWSQVKKAFPTGTFAPGVTDFGGKTYAYPFTSNQRLNNGLLYNSDYLAKAGYDGSKVLSWDDFRAAARKCTQQGGGRYYGVIVGMAQTGQLTGYIEHMAMMAGAHGDTWPGSSGVGGPFNWKTGTYSFTDPIYEEAVDLMLAMKSDGSFFPGTAGLTAPQARGQFPQGVAAMILQGPWNIPAWRKSNPQLKFGFNLPPQKDPKNVWPINYGPGGSNTWLVYAQSKAKPVVGHIFAYLGTLKGQTEWADYDGAGDPPQFKQVSEHAQLDPISAKALALGYKWTAVRPDPALKTGDVALVAQAFRAPQPNWNDTLVGLFTGQVKLTPKAALQDLQGRYEAALESAINTARSRGANISIDDWKFSDWNPRVPYQYPTKT
jgi:multiple sugar transport system substrate-binding protein